MAPTWKNTLHTETNMDITTLANSCFDLGYEYMVWDGYIYNVFFQHPVVAWADTDFVVDDIE